MSNTLVRILTAVVLAPVVLLLVLWERPVGLWLLVMLFNVAAYLELLAMAPGGSDRVDKAVVVGVGVAFSAGLYHRPELGILYAGSVVLVLLTYAVVRYRQIETVGARVAGWFLTVFYAGILFSGLALLKKARPDGDWVLLAMTTSWFADTGAYFTGRALGGPKIYPALSPKKTLSGSVGGLVAALGAGVLAKLWYMPQLSWAQAVALCAVGGVMGQVGDFAESLLKRSFGVKDSGRLLPGHGGVLDRVDALMFVSATFFFYVTVFG